MKNFAIYPVVLLMANLASPALHAKDDAKDRKILARYASCLVKDAQAASRDFVLSGKQFNKKEKTHATLLRSECLRFTGTMAVSDDLLRGSLAEELLSKEASLLSKTDFSAVAGLDYQEPWPLKTTDADGRPLPQTKIDTQAQAIARKTDVVARQRLGECVVRVDPANSAGLLSQLAGSPAEMVQIQSLKPALAGCIVAGQTIKLDRLTVRSNVASAFYRLASAELPAGKSN